MRHYPETPKEFEQLEYLNVLPWQALMLKRNPSYVSWGNTEDYMFNKSEGWNSPQVIESWKEIWAQDDLNEIVNGYYFLSRAHKECQDCSGDGLNKETTKIANAWYNQDGAGLRWCDNITQDEVEALVRQGRLESFVDSSIHFDEDTGRWLKRTAGDTVLYSECEPPQMPSAEQVNKWYKTAIFGHDSINRWICIETRAKRLGVYGKCQTCKGNGFLYTEDTGSLNLQLWVIHPRKGCSRGLIVKNICESDIPSIEAYFQQALSRTNERFANLAGNNKDQTWLIKAFNSLMSFLRK